MTPLVVRPIRFTFFGLFAVALSDRWNRRAVMVVADVVDAASVFGAATSAEIVLPSLVGVGLAVMHPAAMLAVDALSYLGSAVLVAKSTGRTGAPEGELSGRSSENAVSRRRERLRNSFLSRLFAIV